ncbi:MAG TPA: SatD family protein [Candidatus Acidoferrum sp.]|nr:SatD family protein [Candidatus Acidoferrum sp.]
MPAKLYAVLIADIVASSAQRRLRNRLGATLALASRRHLRRKLIRLPYSVTAGDEFQTVCADVHSLPQLILDLRVLLQPLSLRIGIGIGRIADRIKPPVNRLSGEAFQSARTAIDKIKSGGPFKFDTLTFFVSPDTSLDETLNLIYGLNDTLLSGVTHKQWNTIAAFTRNPALARTSRQLHRDASTISRNLKRGYYWQLSETVRTTGPLLSRAFG